MATTAPAQKVDLNDPNVKRLVYNMYRGMLGGYNGQANDMVDSMPRNVVTEDQGIYNQLKAIINQNEDGRGAGPPPPPPPPGCLPTRRLQTEIPERGNEPPAAIQNAMMTKDKKPFTYTPGGLDLSQIKSPKMARRINRNAQAEEIHGQHAPAHTLSPTAALTPAAVAAMQPQLATQVFPTGPPPPPPPPNGCPPPPPPMQHNQSQALPKIRGFDPNEILNRPSKLQPRPQSFQQQQQQQEVQQPTAVPPQPSRAQLGSIYIPPVSPQEISSPGSAHSYIVTSPPTICSTPDSVHSYSASPSSTPDSAGAELRKAPTPWLTQQRPQPQSSPAWAEQRQTSQQQQQPQQPAWAEQRQTPQQQQLPQQPAWAEQRQTPQQQPPQPAWAEQRSYQQAQPRPVQQQGGTRIIPIQVEGRETPSQVQPQVYQQSSQPQQYQQPQQRSGSANSRIIPIQLEGAASPVNRQQQRYNPATPSSPTPYSPPNADGNSQQPPPQWASVQPRPVQQEHQQYQQPPRPVQQEHHQTHPQYQQQDFSNYNTAGVPLSQLKKMQLSDDDRALMDKLKSQVDDETYLHREADPRYRGAAIPSRAFKMLQSMTDTAGDAAGPPGSRGPSRGPPSRPQSANPYQQEAGVAYVPPSEQQVQEPRKYTGASIPSRSFRMLQAMTGQDAPVRSTASPGSPSGRETPVGRWCPSPAPTPMEVPYYYPYYPPPPDPYAYYNYISDLNAAYGYPPPPPPPPYAPPPRFPNYMSDSDEQGYSSELELGQYYANYRRNMGYPPGYPFDPNSNKSLTPKASPTTIEEPKKAEKEKEKVSEISKESSADEESGSDESVSSSSEEDETDTDDTEIEEEKRTPKKIRKSSNKLDKQGSLQALKSVSDVNIFQSESSATVTNDEWEDAESRVGDDDQETEEEEEEEEESEEEEDEEKEEELQTPIPLEETIPHQLSVIFEESEYSVSVRSGTKSVTSESSTATLDNNLEDVEEEDEDDESDDENLMSQSSVTVRLPLQLKFSREKNEEVTTVIVGDSEVKQVPHEESSGEEEEEEEEEENEEVDEEEDDDLAEFHDVEKSCEEEIPYIQDEVKSVKDSGGAKEVQTSDVKLTREEETDEYKSDEADVSFTFSIPTRSNSVITVLSNEDDITRQKMNFDAIHEEEKAAVDAEVTVSVCLPKKAKNNVETEREETNFSNWLDKVNDEDCAVETDKTEEKVETNGGKLEEPAKTYEEGVEKLEAMISSMLRETKAQTLRQKDARKLNKRDSKDSVDESDGDDSGVTSDMSTKPQNSETDGDGDAESDISELSKMTQFQRASTHSRLFKLLQDECDKSDTEDDGEETSESNQCPSPMRSDPQSISARKEKLTLPLNENTPESLSSSSGVTSPSSPTVTDRLVKELVQSLLHKKKGKKFRKLPIAKLHAAALRILQEDMDPYDTSSASASDSPVNKVHSQDMIPEQPPAPESIYGENYYDYLEYYNTWGHPAYYPQPDYDIVPSRAFHYLNHSGYSPTFKAKCPRIPLPPMPAGYPPPPIPPPYQRPYDDPPEISLTFADKRDKVAKVLDKPNKT